MGKSSGGGAAGATAGPTFTGELWSNLLKQLVAPPTTPAPGGDTFQAGFGRGAGIGSMMAQGSQQQRVMTDLERRVRLMDSLIMSGQHTGEV